MTRAPTCAPMKGPLGPGVDGGGHVCPRCERASAVARWFGRMCTVVYR
jgi:hypothetical protein